MENITYNKKSFSLLWYILIFGLILSSAQGNLSEWAAKQRSPNSPSIFDLTEFIKQRLFFTTADYIKRAVWIPHEENTDASPTILIVIHGTWAKRSPAFQKDNDPTYEMIKLYAHKLSAKNKNPVLLLSFGWSGINNEDRRRGAGSALVELCNWFSRKDAKTSFFVIAHSHGGNVALYASHYLQKPFNVLVNLGTPTRDQSHYRPGNIKVLYNLYSTSDAVQIAGSVIQEELYTSLMSKGDARRQPLRLTPLPDGTYQKVFNIHTKINATPPSHLSIKQIIIGLFELIENIDGHYTLHNDLVANVVPPPHIRNPAETLVAINNFLTTKELLERRDINLMNVQTIQQLASEVDYSNAQEKKFHTHYPLKQNIREKGSMLGRTQQSVSDMYRFILAYGRYIANNLKKALGFNESTK